MVLEFLLRHAARTGSPNALRDGRPDAARRWPAAASTTSSAAGSRATRVDRGWVVPHFEKMLYDNAQLLGVYARWWRQTGDPLGERVARETADFLLRELRTDRGRVRLRAGRRHRGRRGQVLRLDARPSWSRCSATTTAPGRPALLEVTEAGTFEHGASTLQLLADPDDPERWDVGARAGCSPPARRGSGPARDDKVVAAWNGLAVAVAGRGRRAARRAAVRRRGASTRRGCSSTGTSTAARLRRVSRDGVVGRHAGVLEDYGCVAHGLLALLSATGDAAWLRTARTAARRRAGACSRAGDGGFFDTAEDAEPLVVPAARPLRQRQPVRPVGAGARAARLRRA